MGIYSTTGGIFPKEMKEVHKLFLQGCLVEARILHLKLQAVNRFLEYDPGYVSPARKELNMLGLPAGLVRRSNPNLTEQQREDLRKALKIVGLL
jgi:dihydrodipicolinate synthase/N-acetylneuraminate lyase